MIKEFKEFINRGSVIDLAVGVIIGGAMGKIVTSVVEDLLMPIIGLALGGVNFTDVTLQVNNATIRYGSFIQNVIDFLITAICIFVFIKIKNKLLRKEEAKVEIEEEVTISKEEELLTEIRDLLKNK